MMRNIAPWFASSGTWRKMRYRSQDRIRPAMTVRVKMILRRIELPHQYDFYQSQRQNSKDDVERHQNAEPDHVLSQRAAGDQDPAELDGANQRRDQHRINQRGKHQLAQAQIHRHGAEQSADDGDAPGA